MVTCWMETGSREETRNHIQAPTDRSHRGVDASAQSAHQYFQRKELQGGVLFGACARVCAQNRDNVERVVQCPQPDSLAGNSGHGHVRTSPVPLLVFSLSCQRQCEECKVWYRQRCTGLKPNSARWIYRDPLAHQDCGNVLTQSPGMVQF